MYQDAASDVLLAICRHSWRVVAQHLETEVLTGVFPHRSLLYVMGILTSNGMSCPRGLRHPQPALGRLLSPDSQEQQGLGRETSQGKMQKGARWDTRGARLQPHDRQACPCQSTPTAPTPRPA